MSYPISEIGDVGPAFADRLKKLKIRTTSGLLEAAKNPRGRRVLAEKTGAEPSRILKWANTADKMRVKGIGEEYSELLGAVGVKTVRDLKYRNPKKLAEAMAVANKGRKLVQILPSEKAVTRWITAAKSLPLKISY